MNKKIQTAAIKLTKREIDALITCITLTLMDYNEMSGWANQQKLLKNIKIKLENSI